MDIGTFLLMQSQAARPSQDVYARGIVVIGTPARSSARSSACRNWWASRINCSLWFGDVAQARIPRSMERFAKEVMPAVE